MPRAASTIAAAVADGLSPDVEPFQSSAEHLLTELERFHLLLHSEILRMRATNVLNENQFRGLYVSDEQVDAILATSIAQAPATAELQEVSAKLAAVSGHLAARLAATRSAGIVLPLDRLAELYSLSPAERDIVLWSCAAELDPRFETLCSYVQNDVTRKRPTVGLIFRLLASDPAERLNLRPIFSAGRALLQTPLIRFSDEPQERDLPFLARPVRAEERIVDFLLDQPHLDSRVRSFTICIEPSRRLASLHLPRSLSETLARATGALKQSGGVLFFHGPAGAGKRSAAEAASAEMNRALVIADLRQAHAAGTSFSAVFALLQREARLRDANLLLTNAGLPPEDHQAQALDALSESQPGLIVFVSSEDPLPRMSTSFEFPIPGVDERQRLWRDAIEAGGMAIQAEAAQAVAGAFALTGGQIHAACRMARSRAMLRGETTVALGQAELAAAARAQSNQALSRRAQKVKTKHDWRDLVLPSRPLQQLREVCGAARHRRRLYEEWGFERRLDGKGLNALFCGPSGTGKTMSAAIVAGELALDLYKIDLSTVVSKYIGETEKQLSQIFREAQSSNAILFFDEADAIFGKRSEVKDAHDRYANIEVSYLLQRMEDYEGLVILSSNFRKNIDEAFTRRIHYIVEFPFPDAPYRERIWRGMVPQAAPLSGDVDFAFLGRQFELSGGNIRNIVLAAASLAAERGGIIAMKHFILATARELDKIGKTPSRADFREYYDLTRDRE